MRWMDDKKQWGAFVHGSVVGIFAGIAVGWILFGCKPQPEPEPKYRTLTDDWECCTSEQDKKELKETENRTKKEYYKRLMD